jgi:hypothetical protein
MKNQVYAGVPTSGRFFACPITVKSGDFVLIGKQPACALNDYQGNSGGATFYFNGSFTGLVYGSSTHSPITGVAVNPGDALFASGTLDTPTNVTTGLWISGDVSDVPFGHLDPTASPILSGAIATAALIRLGDN